MALDKSKYKPVGGITTDRSWPEKNQNLQVGDSIEGTYIGLNENVGPNKSNIYILETKDDVVGVWGSTVIDTKMEKVKLGAKVAIEYLGINTGKKSGKGYKDFFVGQDGDEQPSAASELPSRQLNEDPLPF